MNRNQRLNGSTSAFQTLLHGRYKFVEYHLAVVWTWRCFRMELDCHNVVGFVDQPLHCAVIQIDMGYAHSRTIR